MKTQRIQQFVFAAVCLAAAAPAPSRAQTIGGETPRTISDSAQNFIANMPDLRGGSVAAYTPMYAPRTTRVAFYEAKVIYGRENRGSMILDVSGRVVSFTTKGPSFQEQLQSRLTMPFKMVRFTPRYVVAEDASGKRLASVGELPMIRVHHLADTRFETGVNVESSGNGDRMLRSIDTSSIRPYATEEIAYEDYVRNYDAYFVKMTIKPSIPDILGKVQTLMDPDPSDPNGEAGGGSGSPSGEFEYSAIGYNPKLYYPQLEPSDPLNTSKGMYTGCGASAFLNLFRWHDTYWTPELIPNQDFYSYQPTTMAYYLNSLRDALGTFESVGDLGATFWWNMTEGVDFVAEKMGHVAEWATADGEPGFADMASFAKNALQVYGKPVIIGYWADIHYDIAYHAFQVGGETYFLAPAGWVIGTDLFYAGTAFDFRKWGNYIGTNHGFEHGLQKWSKKAGPNGKVAPMLRATNAKRGTGYARMSATSGGKQKLWRTVMIPGGALSGNQVSVWIRGNGNLTGELMARQITVVPSSEPTGAIIASTSFGTTYNAWTKIVLALPAGAKDYVLEVAYEGPVGMPSSLDVDFAEATVSFQVPPNNGPNGPCVTGKQGLDEGCEDLP